LRENVETESTSVKMYIVSESETEYEYLYPAHFSTEVAMRRRLNE